MTDHFKPLWARNVPKFGIAHAMALGVSTCIPVYFLSASRVMFIPHKIFKHCFVVVF